MMSTINTDPSILTPIYNSVSVCMRSEYVGSNKYMLWTEKSTDAPNSNIEAIMEYMGYCENKNEIETPLKISLKDLKAKEKSKHPWPTTRSIYKFLSNLHPKRKK